MELYMAIVSTISVIAVMYFPSFKNQGFAHTQNLYTEECSYYENILNEITDIVKWQKNKKG